MNNYSEKQLIIGMLMCIAFIVFIMCINDSGWNSGHCSCGGSWEYKQAVGHRYSTMYLYECNRCGKVKEFYEKHEEAEE